MISKGLNAFTLCAAGSGGEEDEKTSEKNPEEKRKRNTQRSVRKTTGRHRGMSLWGFPPEIVRKKTWRFENKYNMHIYCLSPRCLDYRTALIGTKENLASFYIRYVFKQTDVQQKEMMVKMKMVPFSN